jgi:spermidine/putrescine transport system ATP-binding protein
MTTYTRAAGVHEEVQLTQADIRLDHVTKRFHDVVAVDDLELEIVRGEFFSLLGPSGCGKTTTLRLVAGFEEATAGSIYLGDQEVSGLPAYKRDVNTVFQNYALFPHLNVYENVAFGLRRRRVSNADIKTRVGQMLDLVELPGYERRKPSQLSGGQQQRVALARALINHPRVLLLDEPLGALDLKLRKQMQLELKRIQTEVGITFVYVTHDQDEAMTMSDRIAVMRSGRIEQLGDPVTLYEHPATEFVAGFLGVSNLLEGRVAAVRGDVSEVALADGPTVRVATNGLADGSSVRVGVRPEKLRVVARGDSDGGDDGAGNLNRLDGTIVDASYIGVSTQYIVRVNDSTNVAVYAQNIEISGRHEQLAAGSPVRLTWKPEHTFVIQRRDGSVGAEELAGGMVNV